MEQIHKSSLIIVPNVWKHTDQGRIQDLIYRGRGAEEYGRTHITNAKPGSPLRPARVQGPFIKGPCMKAVGFLMLCLLSELFFFFFFITIILIQIGLKKHSRSKFKGGGGGVRVCCAPLWIRHYWLLTANVVTECQPVRQQSPTFTVEYVV